MVSFDAAVQSRRWVGTKLEDRRDRTFGFPLLNRCRTTAASNRPGGCYWSVKFESVKFCYNDWQAGDDVPPPEEKTEKKGRGHNSTNQSLISLLAVML